MHQWNALIFVFRNNARIYIILAIDRVRNGKQFVISNSDEIEWMVAINFNKAAIINIAKIIKNYSERQITNSGTALGKKAMLRYKKEIVWS